MLKSTPLPPNKLIDSSLIGSQLVSDEMAGCKLTGDHSHMRSPMMQSPLMRWLRLPATLVACAGFALSPGCSTFSARRGSLTDYDEAARGINSGAGIYRPEGKSAETDYFAAGFLDRIGLRAKKRRDIDVAKGYYAEADEIFEVAKTLEGEARKAEFRKAAEKYKLAGENWQSSGVEQDALIMAAESHFFAEDYVAAEELYANLIKEYPKNRYLDHVDSRRFEIADYWLRTDAANPTSFMTVNFTDKRLPLNDTGGHGKRILENVRLDNPTGKIGDDATMRLAMEHYESGRYEDAKDTFEDLRMTYPDSEHLLNAMILELKSGLASYQGPNYSSIPITDAQKRMEQIVRQFPQEASQRKDELQESYAKIRYSMAERIWNQAKYRRSRGENDAARFHYNRILEEYGDTPFADQAKESLEAIADAPGVPPQRFKALVWLLGGTTDKRPTR